MKIAFASDLHIEFEFHQTRLLSSDPNVMPVGPSVKKLLEEDFDVLVLAGDIAVGADQLVWYLKELVSRINRPIVFTTGNHEYYDNVVQRVDAELYDLTKDSKDLYFLQNDSVVIGGVEFVGGTLWTSLQYNNIDGMNEEDVKRYMNDFNCIKVIRRNGDTKKWSIPYWKGFHNATYNYIGDRLQDKTTKQVVVTHHAPIPEMSTFKKWPWDRLTSAYVNEFNSFFEDGLWTPELWISGHTHCRNDVTVGATRFVSNCRGYVGHEKIVDTFEWRIVEI